MSLDNSPFQSPRSIFNEDGVCNEDELGMEEAKLQVSSVSFFSCWFFDLA